MNGPHHRMDDSYRLERAIFEAYALADLLSRLDADADDIGTAAAEAGFMIRERVRLIRNWWESQRGGR